MEKVIYNGKQISNWVDYINHKFADSYYFNFETRENSQDIIVISKTNKTKILFSLNSGKLYDCQFYNDSCKGWSGELTGPEHEIISQNNIDVLNRILETPIYKGWTSVDYYFLGSFYKSKTYFDSDKTKTPFTCFSDNFGCLSIILFPIFIPINLLMWSGLWFGKKEIIVDPIIKNDKTHSP